jgi:cation diffusion facilitator CzcD-associated flavoprotein CzcO
MSTRSSSVSMSASDLGGSWRSELGFDTKLRYPSLNLNIGMYVCMHVMMMMMHCPSSPSRLLPILFGDDDVRCL